MVQKHNYDPTNIFYKCSCNKKFYEQKAFTRHQMSGGLQTLNISKFFNNFDNIILLVSILENLYYTSFYF